MSSFLDNHTEDEYGRCFCKCSHKVICHSCCVDFTTVNEIAEEEHGLRKKRSRCEEVVNQIYDLDAGIKFMEQNGDTSSENYVFHQEQRSKILSEMLRMVETGETTHAEIEVAGNNRRNRDVTDKEEKRAMYQAWKKDNPMGSSMPFGGAETQKYADQIKKPPSANLNRADSHVCSWCNKFSTKEKFKVCSGCGMAYYCSTKCQKDGWKGHKKECKKNQKKGTEKSNKKLPLTWSQLQAYGYGNVAEGKTLEVRMVRDASFMRQVVKCIDREGMIKTVACYNDAQRIEGLSQGAVLRWKNPRYHVFGDGQTGARIEEPDMKNVKVKKDFTHENEDGSGSTSTSKNNEKVKNKPTSSSSTSTSKNKPFKYSQIACANCEKKMEGDDGTCSGCRSIRYCSKTCQAQHWRETHRTECFDFAITNMEVKSDDLRVLVIAGHMFDLEDDFWLHGTDDNKPGEGGFIDSFNRRGLQHTIISYSKKKEALKQLRTGKFNVCVILNCGSCGAKKNDVLVNDKRFRQYLKSWVNKGGSLFVQGERFVTDILNQITEKQWKQTEYRRVTHNGQIANSFFKNLNKPPPRYNVKACMLSGVDIADQLYSTGEGATTQSPVSFMAGVPMEAGLTAIAATHVGTQGGRVSFFGDVNAEQETIDTVVNLIEIKKAK